MSWPLRAIHRLLLPFGVGLLLGACSLGVPGSAGPVPDGGSTPPGPGAVAERPVLASSSTRITGADGGSIEVRIELNEVRATDRLLQVTFTARNAAPVEVAPLAPIPVEQTWEIGNAFDDGMTIGREAADAADGVYLLDRVADRRYLPSRTPDGVCVCSTGLSASHVRPGAGEVVTATFGAPPPEVATVDVVVPGVPPFTGIRVSR